jgi:tetratricopeptide (TPR) repeat protein
LKCAKGPVPSERGKFVSYFRAKLIAGLVQHSRDAAARVIRMLRVADDNKCAAFQRVIYSAAFLLIWGSLVSGAAAENSVLSNVDLCNGRDRSSTEPQIRGCTALIKSDADNPKVLAIAFNNRGNAYARQGQYDLAIQDYDKSINLDPNFAKPLNNRGVVYKKQGDYDRALQDFNAAIFIDSNYADAFANRAEIYQEKRDYPGALKDLDQAIRLQSDLGVLFNERCWIRAITGELQPALSDCNEAVRLDPNAAAGFDSRGFTYLKLGQWDLAIADFNSALRFDPKLPSALYGRGYAKMKKGDSGNAKSDIAAAQAIKQSIGAEYASYGVH